MPKQFITVYIGTLLESSSTGTLPVHVATSRSSRSRYCLNSKHNSQLRRWLHYPIGNNRRDVVHSERSEPGQARRNLRSPKSSVSHTVPFVERSFISHHSQTKLTGDVLYQNSGITGSNDDTIFNPNASDVNLTTPLAHSDAPYDSPYQQWDRQGLAVGYAADPRVFAPQPRRANASFDAALVVPSRTGSVTGAGPSRQESTDTAGWELQTNAADGQAYPLHSIPEPVEPLRNPFENASSETIIPTTGPPPARSSAGEYAFSAPQHSFEGNSATRTFSPPPPTYQA